MKSFIKHVAKILVPSILVLVVITSAHEIFSPYPYYNMFVDADECMNEEVTDMSNYKRRACRTKLTTVSLELGDIESLLVKKGYDEYDHPERVLVRERRQEVWDRQDIIDTYLGKYENIRENTKKYHPEIYKQLNSLED